MIFCNNCFKDNEVQDIIIGLGEKGDCPICRKRNAYIYNTAVNTELTELFEGLIEIYTPLSLLSTDFPRENSQLLKEELKQNWNIFSDKVSSANVYKIITNICSELYLTNPKIFDEPIAIKELLNEEYIKNNSIIKDNTWEDFVNCIKYESRFHIDCIAPKIIDDFFYLSKTNYSAGQIFYRARISDEKGFVKSEMSAPPKEEIKNGRANPEGIRCLYLASDIDTTIHEVRANIFDHITVGKFILKKDITLVNFKQMSNISPFVVNDLTKYAINRPVLMKINNEIAKSVSRNDSMLTYLPTQYICDYIKSIWDIENKKNMYDGIEYSSTTYPKGYNVAIFNPELCECEKIEIYKIKSIDYEKEMIWDSTL